MVNKFSCLTILFYDKLKVRYYKNPFMSKRMTPEEVLSSVVEGINTGNMDSLMALYEVGACFATQPGQLAKDPESIRQCLRNFIHLEGNLDLKVKRVFKQVILL